ncbi:4-hydroxy-tetrahydrodipicolinate reductase [hydrothermal vent metagenome]|uniref:4-hydroxy-tetrahydrodipicolinate reductase n=1 Tax=hydrothermal vent metagenome TaxID=652676 RepID=A0A3B1BZS5_9ZZZZ
MIKAVVTGCAGRMGRAIINAVESAEGIELYGATDLPGGPFIGQDAGEVAGVGKKGVAITGDLAGIIGKCDVVIDFSVPSASLEHFLKASEAGVAIVIGTTGFDEEHWTTFEAMSKTSRAVIAPNMSVGVNALFKLAKEAASILGDDYDVEIVEMHHNKKVDAPSGTADRLARDVAHTLNRDLDKVGNYGRHGQVGARPPKEIGVQTLRGGDVVGEHTVIFAGVGERIELTHRAGSRDNFAAGAVRAAMWAVNQPNGVYDMQDVLGL